MPAEPVQRRLAAILAADVAGYSRLMGEDEEGTLATLTAHLQELIEPCIAEHRGRVAKTYRRFPALGRECLSRPTAANRQCGRRKGMSCSTVKARP